MRNKYVYPCNYRTSVLNNAIATKTIITVMRKITLKIEITPKITRTLLFGAIICEYVEYR